MYKQVIRPMLCAILVFCIALGFQMNALATSSVTVDDSNPGSNSLFPITGFNSVHSDDKQYNGLSTYQAPYSNSPTPYYFSYNAPINFTGTLHIQLYVYLWCNKFDNQKTVYCANVFNSYPIRGDVGAPFDQKNAPTGWNLVNKDKSIDVTDYFDFYGISVASSSGATTGADAIMIVYWID